MDTSFRQVGALPYRLSSSGEVEILIVTSRGTKQWIIPKGWPMEDRGDPDAAAREAFEEAGLIGEVDQEIFGTFSYEKPMKGAQALSTFVVDVYPLRVDRQLAFWPEATQRTLVWVSVEHGRGMIRNATLIRLIEAFVSQYPFDRARD